MSAPVVSATEGLLRLARNLVSEMLEIELAVTEGEHAGTSFRIWLTLFAGDNSEARATHCDQYQPDDVAGDDRERNAIDPDDDSAEAQKIRDIETLRAFDGLTFYALGRRRAQ